MLGQNYHSEKAIKQIARILMVAGIVIVSLAFLAMFIILAVNARYLWWVSLIVLGGGLLNLFVSFVFANFIWGFGEIVGNSHRIATGTSVSTEIEEAPLPEL